jgi:hypothetical protein
MTTAVIRAHLDCHNVGLPRLAIARPPARNLRRCFASTQALLTRRILPPDMREMNRAQLRAYWPLLSPNATMRSGAFF